MDNERAKENVFEFKRKKDAIIDDIVAILRTSDHKSEYINECQEELLKLKEEQFQKTIAIYGRTGSGKSSLLNALLDRHEFLPVSESSACTAVAVEISSNFVNENYEADVEFLTKEDWEAELELRRMCDDDFKPERLPYNNKLVEEYQQFSDASAEDFIERISHYMSASPRESSEIDEDDEVYDVNDCDFVKRVMIRAPNSDICSCGITLVDLPGKGDMHVARNRIANEYVQECNAIWIVSPIIRAISDDIQAIIDEDFFQKLLMERRYGTLSFICTKTDDIDVNNYIKEKKLHKDSDIERLKLALKEVEKNTSENNKRKKELSKDPTANESDLQECKHATNSLLVQKYRYDQELKDICIKHRNQYCRERLERILKLKLSKLFGNNSQLITSQTPSVFCISTQDYRESKESGNEPLGNRSGISELAKHEKTTINLCIDQFKEGFVHRLTERILMIVNSLSDPVKAEPSILKDARKLFDAQQISLQNTIGNIRNEIMAQIKEKYKTLEAAIDRGNQKSVSNACKIVERWEDKYRFQTYQATVRRNGEYYSRSEKARNVDFNYELCSSFIKEITRDWVTLFEIPVEEIHQQMLTAKKDLHSKLQRELSIAPFSTYNIELPGCTDRQLKSDIKYIENNAKKRDRKINAMIKNKVMEDMIPAYKLCLKVDSGKNRFQKMNSIIRDHVNTRAAKLFADLGNNVKEQIVLWITWIDERLCECSDRMLSDIKGTYEPIFEQFNPVSDKITISHCLLKSVDPLKLLYVPESINSNDEELFHEIIEKCKLLLQKGSDYTSFTNLHYNTRLAKKASRTQTKTANMQSNTISPANVPSNKIAANFRSKSLAATVSHTTTAATILHANTTSKAMSQCNALKRTCANFKVSATEPMPGTSRDNLETAPPPAKRRRIISNDDSTDSD